MNIEYLRNFIKVVESGTILNASKLLYIAQPSLSNQMKELEKIYGCELFKRGRRNLTLTSSGEIVYNRAKQIITLFDSSLLEVNEFNSQEGGTLHIALSPSIYQDLVHFHFAKFMQTYPNVHFNVYEVTSVEAEKLLQANIVEIAIVNPSIMNKSKYNSLEIVKESFQVILNKNSSLLQKEIVSLIDLNNVPIAVPRAYVDELLEQARNASINIILDTITSSSIGAITLAHEKNIVAICPLPNDETIVSKEYVRSLHLSNYNKLSRNLIWLKGKKLSPVAQLFIDLYVH